MALVHNHVSIILDHFVYCSFVDKALDGGYVDDSGRPFASTSNPADSICRQCQKQRQSLNPLFLQLPPMHKDKRIDGAFCNEPCTNHSLAESGGRGSMPISWASKALPRVLALAVVALEMNVERFPPATFVSQDST